MQAQQSLTKYVATFVDQLFHAGVKHVVISPGSRSTPLALLMAEHPKLKVWLHVDERSAAFFALGIAKANDEPVAILCTSGTAAANYYPAVIEAKEARVPLIVLTADRPHELRDSGAPQTIDQVRLYSTYPKWFVDMPLPEASHEMLRFASLTATRAAETAIVAPAGPVHLNFPFREPLVPDLTLSSLWKQNSNDAHSPVTSGVTTCSDDGLKRLGEEISQLDRVLIMCGSPVDDALTEPLMKLATKLQIPVLADPLSQLRTGSHNKQLIIDSYDAFLRIPEIVAQLEPEAIIRFGAMPVSKAYMEYSSSYPNCKQIIIDEGRGWRDPTLMVTDVVHTDPQDFCTRLHKFIEKRDTEAKADWVSLWQSVNAISQEAVLASAKLPDLFEGQVLRETITMLPEEAVLFVGNSMPIRDLDTFLLKQEKPLLTMANRGANGIDGVTSSALGVASQKERLVLVIGDLSFYHDLNGLLAAKLFELDVTIVVLNNDGGGIFSFLPQAAEDNAHFEQLFGTPIGLDFQHSVEMYGGTFTRITSWETYRDAFQSSIETDGLHVIEVQTDRAQNVEWHDQIWNNVEEAIRSQLVRNDSR